MEHFLVGFIVLQVVLGILSVNHVYGAGDPDDDYDNDEAMRNEDDFVNQAAWNDQEDARNTAYGEILQLGEFRERIIFQRLNGLSDNNNAGWLSRETTSWKQWVSDWEAGSAVGYVEVRDPLTTRLRCLFMGYDACFSGCIRFVKDPVEERRTAIIAPSYKRDKCNGLSSPKETLTREFDESERMFHDLDCSPTASNTAKKFLMKLDCSVMAVDPYEFAKLMDVSWTYSALNMAVRAKPFVHDEEMCGHYCSLHPDCVAYCPNLGMEVKVKAPRITCELFKFA